MDQGLRIAWAIANHPWVDADAGAAVRVAMTVGHADFQSAALGQLLAVEIEGDTVRDTPQIKYGQQQGDINADLTIGAKVTKAIPLISNLGICCEGMKLHGEGFILEKTSGELLRKEIPAAKALIKEFRNGRDIVGVSRDCYVIDLFGLSETELRSQHPRICQHLLENVKPEREFNNRKTYRKNWWLFGECRAKFRPLLASIKRMIVTVKTAKFRHFIFIATSVIPESKLIAVAIDDAFFLGILESNIHTVWTLANCGWLGVGNDPTYVIGSCFDPFPFPAPTKPQEARIRQLGEDLDAHRKRQQAAYPGLTLTGMYNVLVKLRSGEALTAKEKIIHEQGLCSVLKTIHDDLDATVAGAFGWPVGLPDDELLTRLVRLNAERAAEEKKGVIRWLRPDYQQAAVGGATTKKPKRR